MTTKPENPPAFPVDFGSYGIEPTPGMTLRDYFAGQALMGEIAATADGTLDQGTKSREDALAWDAKRRAIWCYQQADAMLAARATEG